MPVVRINAEKDARCTQSVVQLQGDTRTTMVRFIVNRYDGGVDLAGIVWLIKTTNAAGVPDAWEPEMVENAGEKIIIDWLIQGSVNDADGLTEYELNGLGYEADGKAIKWVGGKGTVSVRKSYHPTFGDDTDGFSNLEKLIIYVNGELQDTVAAVERAEAAATAAAAASEDSIWTSKPQGLSFGQQLQAQENIGLLEVVKNLTNPVKAEGNPVQEVLVGGLPFDKLATVLEPVQAGSGDPYPAGGGKNLLKRTYTDAVVTENGITFMWDNGVVTANGTATATATFRFATTSELQLPAGTYTLSGCPADGSNAKYGFGITFPDGTASSYDYGNTRTFTIDEPKYIWPIIRIYAGTTVNNLVFKPQIEEGTTATEYEPYSNIRPISGYDSLKLTRCGKNLLPNNATTQTVNGVTFTVNADGSVNVSGTSTVDYVTLELDADLRLVSGEYRLSQPYNGIGCVINRYVRSTHAYSKFITSAGNVFNTIDWDYETYVYRVQLQVAASGTSVNGTAYPMIRLASDTDATYEPYQGENFVANFGQTVYGGALDWNKGELTVEWAITTLNGTEGFYVAEGSGEFKNFCITIPEKIAAPHGLVCSHYRYTTDSATWSGNTGISELQGETSKTVRIFDLNYSTGDIDGFKAYLAAQYAAGTPVQIAYKLANPTTIQLTPQEIAQLEGINTLYGDGSIAIIGRQKPDLALVSRIEALESAILNA